MIVLLMLLGTARAQWHELNPVTDVKQQTDGILLTMKIGVLRFQVCTGSMIRVTYAPSVDAPHAKDYVVIKDQWPAAHFTFTSSTTGMPSSVAASSIATATGLGSIGGVM